MREEENVLCVYVGGGHIDIPNQLSLDQSKFLHVLFMAVASAGLVKGEVAFLEQILLTSLLHRLLFYK